MFCYKKKQLCEFFIKVTHIILEYSIPLMETNYKHGSFYWINLNLILEHHLTVHLIRLNIIYQQSILELDWPIELRTTFEDLTNYISS